MKVIGRVARRVSLDEDTKDYMGLGIEFEQYTYRDRWRLEAFLHQERETHGGPPAVQS